MEVEAVAYDFDKRPPDDHPCKIWLYLDQRFQRRDCFKLFVVKISLIRIFPPKIEETQNVSSKAVICHTFQ